VSAASRRRSTRAAAPVLSLVQARIERALRQRTRYRYVTPRVVAEGAGWLVLCANCSRNIDPEGGEIPIAWLLPDDSGAWTLHAHDHARAVWSARASGLTLQAALSCLRLDPAREYWQ
jgi:hypothetical protein